MTNEFAQIAALVTYSNAHLRGVHADRPAIDAHPAFVGIGVTFVIHDRVGPFRVRRRIAGSAGAFIRWLARNRCIAVLLVHDSQLTTPDSERIGASLDASDQPWLIVTRFPERTVWWTTPWWTATWWSGRWSRSRHRAPYSGSAADVALPPDADLAEATEHLRTTVTEAWSFAATQPQLASWTAFFDRAFVALTSPAPETIAPETGHDAQPIVATNGMTLAARQLFAAARRAWVFGGTGSWHDVDLEHADARVEHATIGRNLHRAVVAAMTAAINSSAQAGALSG